MLLFFSISLFSFLYLSPTHKNETKSLDWNNSTRYPKIPENRTSFPRAR